MYEQFFSTVRAVNWMLPKQRRLRVLLGDPPIDWTNVTRVEQIIPFLEGRDAHWATLVEREVLRKNRRALLVVGGAHLMRNFEIPPRSGRFNLRTQIERRYPNSTYMIATHTGFRSAQSERRLAAARRPSIHSLRGSWIGRLKAQEVYFWMPPQDLAGRSFTSFADAYLYLRPAAQLTASVPNPNIYRDPEYLAELQRRAALFGDPPPVDVKGYLLEMSPRYADLGPPPGAGGPLPRRSPSNRPQRQALWLAPR